MRKNYFFTLLLTFCTALSFAQVTLPHYEGFDYPVGTDIATTANWENFSGTDNEIDVTAGSLMYSGFADPTGNAINMVGGFQDDRILFTEVTTGTVYASFLMNVNSVADITDTTDGGYFAIFGSTTNSFRSRLWVKPTVDNTSTTVDFAYTTGSSGSGFGQTQNLNAVVLVVMSYNVDTGEVNAWINPDSSSFEAGSAPAADFTDTDGSPTTIDRFMLRQDSTGETPDMTLDELRIGTTWASVTPSGTVNTDPSITINAPTEGQVFDGSTTEVPVTLTVQNFTLSGDAGGGVSDGSGDGYIVSTLQETGQPDEVTNFFTTMPPAINVVPGRSYTATVELVDNSGNSLAPAVSATVNFSVELPCDLQLGTITEVCENETAGVDTYTASIDFTQGNTTTYTITVREQGTMNPVGTVAGDDPSAVASGTISITGIPEGTDITVNIAGGSGSSCDLNRNISSPVCVPLSCPAAGAIIITEIMQNPSAVSDSNGEYFEVYNTTGSPIDLQGWILKDTSSASETHTITSSVVVPANGYAVLGTNTDMGTNGGVSVDYDYGDSYFLGNSSDDIVLECGGAQIDIVAWDNGATFPDPNGASMELAVSAYNATDNDDGANWGEATSEITSGGDLGTPGAINDFTLSTRQEVIEGFAAYPNPVRGNELTIRSANIDSKTVEIFNVLGRQVFNNSFSGTQETFVISNIASGIYILKVTEGNKVSTQKLIIE